MTSRRPPRLALAMLEHLLHDSAPLAGDIIEEFDRGRPRTWVWGQVLAAVAAAPFRRSDEIRPLRLVDLQPVDAQERSRRLTLRFGPANLTASPLHGIGGLGLVVLSVFVTMLAPGVWLFLLASIVAGIVLGATIIASRG